MVRYALRGLLTLGVVPLVLVGCGDVDKPSAVPTGGVPSTASRPPTAVPSSAAPTASPSSPPEPTPASDRERVEQAVRDYYAAANRAFATGRVAELEARQTPECNCRAIARKIAAHAAQGSVRGGGVTVHSLQVLGVQPQVASVQVDFSAANGEVVDQRGHVVDTITGIQHGVETLVLVKQASGAWLVDQQLQYRG